MSASLVGSEMCIRDRAYKLWRDSTNGGSGGEWPSLTGKGNFEGGYDVRPDAELEEVGKYLKLPTTVMPWEAPL
eukprot:2426427-Alexandrium_andersonii.AAC.1